VESAYRHSTRVLGLLLVVLGVALVVTTVARGGGPLATGVVVGVGIAAFGGARTYLAARTPSPRGRA
jgi:drug/metabolite transporter (DMT)-like permease